MCSVPPCAPEQGQAAVERGKGAVMLPHYPPFCQGRDMNLACSLRASFPKFSSY